MISLRNIRGTNSITVNGVEVIDSHTDMIQQNGTTLLRTGVMVTGADTNMYPNALQKDMYKAGAELITGHQYRGDDFDYEPVADEYYILDSVDMDITRINNTGTFSGRISSIDAAARNICLDDTHVYAIAATSVQKYTFAGALIETITTEGTTGTCWDGTNFWTISGFYLYQLDTDWVRTGIKYNLQDSVKYVTWSGSQFFLTAGGQGNSNPIYIYTSAGVYSGSTFPATVSTNNRTNGITWNINTNRLNSLDIGATNNVQEYLYDFNYVGWPAVLRQNGINIYLRID